MTIKCKNCGNENLEFRFGHYYHDKQFPYFVMAVIDGRILFRNIGINSGDVNVEFSESLKEGEIFCNVCGGRCKILVIDDKEVDVRDVEIEIFPQRFELENFRISSKLKTEEEKKEEKEKYWQDLYEKDQRNFLMELAVSQLGYNIISSNETGIAGLKKYILESMKSNNYTIDEIVRYGCEIIPHYRGEENEIVELKSKLLLSFLLSEEEQKNLKKTIMKHLIDNGHYKESEFAEKELNGEVDDKLLLDCLGGM